MCIRDSNNHDAGLGGPTHEIGIELVGCSLDRSGDQLDSLPHATNGVDVRDDHPGTGVRHHPGELARMMADSGARMVITDVDTVRGVREAVELIARAIEGASDELDADLVSRATQPRVVVI